MRSVGIPWRGNWDPSFRDFFIDRIGPFASAAPDRYWSLTVNGHFSGGGCLARVGDGDSVRFNLRPPLCRTPRGSTVQPGRIPEPASQRTGPDGGEWFASGAAAADRGASGEVPATLARNGRGGLGPAGAGAAA